MSRKILIIDDDIDLVEAMRLTLEDGGFDVLDAQEGDKGFALAQAENPDLVLLDVMMGTQDEGFQVAYRLKQDSKTADIPIIMLTAVSQETGFAFDKEKDDDFLPVEAFIEKPVNPDRLLEVIKITLGF